MMVGGLNVLCNQVLDPRYSRSPTVNQFKVDETENDFSMFVIMFVYLKNNKASGSDPH